MAQRWAGSIDGLWRWFRDTTQFNFEDRVRLRAEPLSDALKDEIRKARALGVENGLDVARRLNLPLDVVRYVADGEPKIDTMRRPWLPRSY